MSLSAGYLLQVCRLDDNCYRWNKVELALGISYRICLFVHTRPLSEASEDYAEGKVRKEENFYIFSSIDFLGLTFEP